MAAFKDPVALLLRLEAKAGLFRLAPLNPARLPVDLVDVKHRQSRALAKRPRQRALARSRRTNDHDPFHNAQLANRLGSAMAGI
jgi:hypothetical protein